MARHPVPLLATALGLALAGPGVHAADLEIVYTTRAGDTLIGLERQYLSAPFGWRGLKALNRIGNPMRLPVGTPLRIPENWLRAQPHTARVVAVSGDVTMDGKPLTPDSRVSAGAILRTGDGGFVTLALPDESRLTVQPGSQARLEKVQSF
ncbi:MAG TPA: LysM peptidoglycan-binding domain-containing protein, partial [Zoogloea sp.]|nr:LysM peptidoglycan-binding domain-containing protein [Zoogloea sp.]